MGAAVEARKLLVERGITAAVVSMPSWQLFDASDVAYRREVLGTAPLLAIEAASPFGWERYVGDRHRVIGMTRFGASAPADALFHHFGFTPEKIADAADELLNGGDRWLVDRGIHRRNE